MDFNLLENAFDYILDAVQQLQGKKPSKKQIKYGLVHLWSGIELLLKKRLMDEDWALIFHNMNKANKKALHSGEFYSVKFDKALERLKEKCEIDIGDHFEVLDAIRNERNKLEHFQISLSKPAVISRLVAAWGFILDFTVSHIDLDSDHTAEKLFEKIKDKMIAHEGFISERVKSIQPELRKIKAERYPYTIIDCPICFQDALILKGETCECLFCKADLDWKSAMEKWIILKEGYHRYHEKDRWNDPFIFECPECEYEALYQFEDGSTAPPDPAAICFHCGVMIPSQEW